MYINSRYNNYNKCIILISMLLFNKYLLSTYYVPATSFRPGDSVVNKLDKISAFTEFIEFPLIFITC